MSEFSFLALILVGILCLLIGRMTINIFNSKNPRIGVYVALALLVGSLCITIGSMIINQLNPSYISGLAVPVYHALSVIIGLLGLAIAVFAYQKNTDMTLAKGTMKLGVACIVVLVLLFPVSLTMIH